MIPHFTPLLHPITHSLGKGTFVFITKVLNVNTKRPGGLTRQMMEGASFRSVPCYFSFCCILSPMSIIALESAALKNVKFQKMNSYIFILRLCFLYIKSLCYLYYLRCLLYWLVLWLNTVKSTPKYPYTQVKSKIWINQVLCLGK